MKITKLFVLGSMLALVTACGSNPDNKASSTPIDSTNLNGEAPVTYGPTDPASPDSPRYQGAYDTGARANTLSGADSQRMGK